MLSLSTVLALESLGLELVGQDPPEAAPIRWAHVSDLADPTPWLIGGEFLLTTGPNLPGDEEGMQTFCRRLKTARVVALGISVGASLPHVDLPDFLVSAAAFEGLPLIHIPEGTPLQQVVRDVSDLLHDEQTLPLRRALAIQRNLTEAAVGGADGIGKVLSCFTENTGFNSVVYDDRMRLVAATSEAASSELQDLRAGIRARLRSGIRWSMTVETHESSSLVLPLGADGEVRGILATTKPGPVSSEDRALLNMMVSLLRMLLELRYAGAAQSRSLQIRSLNAIFTGRLSGEGVKLRLARAGVESSEVQMLRASVPSASEQLIVLVAGLSELFDDVLVYERADEVALLLCGHAPGTIAQIRSLVTDAGMGPAGLGASVIAENVMVSFRQAERAKNLAAARQVSLLTLSEFEGHRALLALGNAAELAYFSDAVLGSIDDAGDDGQKLLAALRAYTDCAGNIESAAVQLGVHRHTIRGRLEKVAQISGRDFRRASDLFELWMALELRDLATVVPDPAKGTGVNG